MDIKVFYDNHEIITLWGKDLYTYLNDIYQNKAHYTVIFCSQHYAKKLWSNHERQAAQARAFESNKEYILPARFDDTKIQEFSTTAYINLNNYTPEKFAELIRDKLGPIDRPNYLPEDPDVLYKKLNLTTDHAKYIAGAYLFTFFESMKLMTVDERIFLVMVVNNCCPCGIPNEIHQSLNYLSRTLNLPPEEIKQSFSRLGCLKFESTIKKVKYPQKRLCQPDEIITIKLFTVVDGKVKNATCIIFPVIEILRKTCCEDCFWRCISKVDFSQLSSLTGYNERL